MASRNRPTVWSTSCSGWGSSVLRNAASLIASSAGVCSRDHWWRQIEDPRVMRAELTKVTSILLTDGLRWLNARTSLVAFRWASRQLERRKEAGRRHTFWRGVPLDE